MTLEEAELDENGDPLDGRVARRQRNVNAVLDVVLEMFAEESLFPTMEQAATRSGLSLRSLYRYFDDPAQLLEAAIKRSRELAADLWRLHAIGQGPLDDRVEAFVGSRLRLYDAVGPMYRATVANGVRHPRVRQEQERNRNGFREQFELQFAPELNGCAPRERTSVVAAGDVITQLDSIDYLRRHRGLSVDETHEILASTLHRLLG